MNILALNEISLSHFRQRRPLWAQIRRSRKISVNKKEQSHQSPTSEIFTTPDTNAFSIIQRNIDHAEQLRKHLRFFPIALRKRILHLF